MQSVTEFLSSIHFQLAWVPDWATSAVLIGIFILLAWWLHALVFRVIARIGGRWDLFWRSLVSRTESPSRFAAIMLAVALAVTIAPLSEAQATAVRQAMIVGIVVLTGWSLIIALHIWLVLHLRRYKLDIEDNLLARKHVTQSRILERIARTLIVVLTLGAALMTFDDVRQYGVGLLASAGAVSLVIGLALQPMLKNLVAGSACHHPADPDRRRPPGQRRVGPCGGNYLHLRGHPAMGLAAHDRAARSFHRAALPELDAGKRGIDRELFLYVDFTVPVGDLRKKLEQIAHASPLWDGRVAALQVTDFKESTMEIRMLVSASSASRAFDLRCEVRERMIAYVQQRFPGALPRLRADLRDQRELASGRMMAE